MHNAGLLNKIQNVESRSKTGIKRVLLKQQAPTKITTEAAERLQIRSLKTLEVLNKKQNLQVLEIQVCSPKNTKHVNREQQIGNLHRVQ